MGRGNVNERGREGKRGRESGEGESWRSGDRRLVSYFGLSISTIQKTAPLKNEVLNEMKGS